MRTLGGGTFQDAAPGTVHPRKGMAIQRLEAMAKQYPDVGYGDRESGAIETGAFGAMVGSTRKYAVSLLEYFDRQRITLRDGNTRRLTANYDRRLLRAGDGILSRS